jgi:hypothetical protein
MNAGLQMLRSVPQFKDVLEKLGASQVKSYIYI